LLGSLGTLERFFAWLLLGYCLVAAWFLGFCLIAWSPATLRLALCRCLSRPFSCPCRCFLMCCSSAALHSSYSASLDCKPFLGLLSTGTSHYPSHYSWQHAKPQSVHRLLVCAPHETCVPTVCALYCSIPEPSIASCLIDSIHCLFHI
jgi:hypothetical protein